MRIRLLFIVALWGFSTVTYAQRDTISYKRLGLGTAYRKDDQLLTMRRLQQILKNDVIAINQLKSGKRTEAIATLFSFTGSFIIGYEVGRTLNGKSAVQPSSLIAGTGLIGIAIPFSISAHKKIKSAVKTYNNNVRK